MGRRSDMNNSGFGRNLPAPARPRKDAKAGFQRFGNLKGSNVAAPASSKSSVVLSGFPRLRPVPKRESGLAAASSILR
jgi:hypothetical protein